MPSLAGQPKCLIAEVIAVGGEPFVAGFVRQFLDKVPDAVTLPNGSLSYLCNRPHYFPDEVSLVLNFINVTFVACSICEMQLPLELNLCLLTDLGTSRSACS
jgi:hypothetical protein